MAFEGVHRLLVVDEAEHLVGIVTSMDVLRELAGFPRPQDRVVAVAPP
jgi:predicted transcriptional regulator